MLVVLEGGYNIDTIANSTEAVINTLLLEKKKKTFE